MAGGTAGRIRLRFLRSACIRFCPAGRAFFRPPCRYAGLQLMFDSLILLCSGATDWTWLLLTGIASCLPELILTRPCSRYSSKVEASRRPLCCEVLRAAVHFVALSRTAGQLYQLAWLPRSCAFLEEFSSV